GTKGNGYYTSAYSIYNILLIMSSYSMPTAISRIVSSRLSDRRFEDIRRALRVAFLYSTIIGALMFGVMFFGAGMIAEFMKKPFVSYALMTLAPTVWIMAYLGILRGYFQGTGNMIPTAVSQILEQVINAVVSIVMASILFGYGAKANLIYGGGEYSYAFGAAGGTIGTGAGALVALLFFILIYCLYGRDISGGEDERGFRRSRGVESYGHLTKVLFMTLIPILLSSFVYNLTTVIDDFVFSRLMAFFGLAESVVLLWGIYGEYRIVFNIPVAIANSMSSSVIPSLAQAVTKKDRALIAQKTNLSLRFTIMIAVPACVGIAFLSDPICKFLFPSETTGMLAKVLIIGSPAIIMGSISTITNGILQGIGKLSIPLTNSVLAQIIHVVVLVVLMFIKPDIYSVIISNVVLLFVICLLNQMAIRKYVRYRTNILKTYIIPLFASLIMGIGAFLLYEAVKRFGPDFLTGSRIGIGITLCVCIGVALLVYFTVLFLLRPFTKEELIEMPLGTRLYRLAHKMHLM
ncbi:MAG: polysaccharide biosynthesis protein, partial [Eubacteriales bacterium]|nr:polysaccharide biosynthesis protein [Eubacteriales bacterium]